MQLLLRLLLSFNLLLPTPLLQRAMFFGQNTSTSGSGGPSYVFVNSASNACSAHTCTVTYSPTAGHEIIVLGNAAAGSGIGTDTLADNAAGGSTAYTTDLSDGGTFRNFNDFYIFHTCSVKSGVTTFTVTNSDASATEQSPIVLDFSGQTGTCFDKITTPGTTGSGTSVSCCSTTPAVANELSIGLIFQANGGTTTGSSGYTCVTVFNGSGGDNTVACYDILSGSSAKLLTASWTPSGSSSYWAYQAMYQ